MTGYERGTLYFAYAAVIIALAELLALCITTYLDHARRKKQSTIEYVNTIRKLYRELNEGLAQKYGDQIIDIHTVDKDSITDIRELLSIVEHLAVGVNTHVYDAKIVNRMSGHYFIKMRERLDPYIRHARIQHEDDQTFLFVDFERMCRKLKKRRKTRDITTEGDLIGP